MKNKGTEILAYGINPYIHFPCVVIRLTSNRFSGSYCFAVYEGSGVPYKPACLYGME
jgi:hypothetical protein